MATAPPTTGAPGNNDALIVDRILVYASDVADGSEQDYYIIRGKREDGTFVYRLAQHGDSGSGIPAWGAYALTAATSDEFGGPIAETYTKVIDIECPTGFQMFRVWENEGTAANVDYHADVVRVRPNGGFTDNTPDQKGLTWVNPFAGQTNPASLDFSAGNYIINDVASAGNVLTFTDDEDASSIVAAAAGNRFLPPAQGAGLTPLTERDDVFSTPSEELIALFNAPDASTVANEANAAAADAQAQAAALDTRLASQEEQFDDSKNDMIWAAIIIAPIALLGVIVIMMQMQKSRQAMIPGSGNYRGKHDDGYPM